MRTGLGGTLAILLAAALSGAAYADGYHGSRLNIEDKCPAPDARMAAVTGAVVTGVVSGALAFVTDELKNLRQRYTGMDEARGVGCIVDGQTLTYERGTFDSNGDLAEGEGTDMVLKSVIKTHGNSFRVVPTELVFHESSATWGSTKDITVTFSFNFPAVDAAADNATAAQVTLEPFVLKDIEEDTTVKSLDKIGITTGLATFPADKHFYMAKITVNETSPGKGAELAARIGESIAEQLTANKDAIISELVGKLND